MSLPGEVRYAARKLLRAPGFTAVAVATLALGIGANAAIFGLVDSVLLRSLPYPEPDRLVMAWQDYTERGGPPDEWFSPATYLDWRDELESFQALGSFSGWGPTLVGEGGDPEALAGATVTRDFLTALGARPAVGRLFTPEEDAAGGPDVVLLGHSFWERRFGGDPSVVGQVLSLGGEPFEVVGVLQPGFEFPMVPGTDVVRPAAFDAVNASRGSIYIRVVGRLAEGATLERAQAEASALASRLAEDHPGTNTGVGANIQPLRDVLVADVRLGLLVLFGGVGAVLLIACVNLASLLLARASQRRRESAVRAALGAGAFRIARLELLETGLLSFAGATAGLVLAVWLMDLLVALSPLGLPAMFQPSLDWRIVGFAFALAVLTTAGFGLVPAVQVARPDLTGGLREGGRGGSVRGGGRRVLVVAQLAFALALLVGAGLLTRSFLALQSVDPGFDPRGVLSMTMTTPRASYPEPAQVAAFYDRLVERVEALPGVESAAAASNLPFSGGGTDVGFVIEGEPAPDPGEGNVIWYRQVTPDFLGTLRIPVVEGRGFTAEDREGTPPVVLFSQAAAERFFPGESPVGRRINPGNPGEDPWWTIVGVAGSAHHSDLSGDPRIEMYIPHAQIPARRMSLTVRAESGDDAALAPAVRGIIREMDRTIAVSDITAMEAMVGSSVALERFLTLCTGAFALLALLLAAIGVYGVISQLVGQRTRELGIRMALGADRRRVLTLVLREGAVMVAAGAALGIVCALAVGRLIQGLLFEVAPLDPVSFLLLPAVLGAVALLATYLPARRAAGTDPVTALRAE
ncbi:MAG: ABC transporter permease [Gemmatimonadetes bacterium]|nr:ABC transporter permease [Gemmatimonadota bacterium]